MTISSGGQALDAFKTVIGNLAGSTGELTVTGSGSQLRTLDRLTVGDGGRGTLLVADEGRVSNDVGIIRVDSSVRVQGNNSTWTNGSILNLFDDAALVIEDGGTVVSVGSNVSGSVTVAGAGSTWSVGGELTVGFIGPGQLNITSGGAVASGTSAVGRNSGSISTLTVAGTGSVWSVGGDLNIGGSGDNNEGVGTVRIQSGGTVAVSQGIRLFADDLLRLEGGTLSAAEVRPGSGQFDWTSGTLHVGLYHGSLTTPDFGILAPGNSVGQTVIDGNYFQQSRGALEIEIGGPASADLVDLTGVAELSGDLQLKLLGGFVPSPASSYVVFDSRGINGSFLNVANGQRLTTTGGLGSFLVSYGSGSPFNPNQLVLSSFIPNIDGDFDLDGDVDGNDFLAWQRGDSPNLGSAADLAAWRGNFGFPGLTPAGKSIPEPRSGWLAAIGAMFALLPQRRPTT
jgi:T5SS/PEP-CTERM-associated repeat protein